MGVCDCFCCLKTRSQENRRGSAPGNVEGDPQVQQNRSNILITVCLPNHSRPQATKLGSVFDRPPRSSNINPSKVHNKAPRWAGLTKYTEPHNPFSTQPHRKITPQTSIDMHSTDPRHPCYMTRFEILVAHQARLLTTDMTPIPISPWPIPSHLSSSLTCQFTFLFFARFHI